MTVIKIGANTTDTFSGVSDVALKDDFPTTNYASETTFETTKYLSSSLFRQTLLRFDIAAASIPAGSIINSVKVWLWLSDSFGYVNDVGLKRLLVPFVANQATYNIRSTGNNWGTAGALGDGTDRAAGNLATYAPAHAQSPGYVEISGAALKSHIEAVVAGSEANNGFVLEYIGEPGGARYVVWASSEGTDGQRPYIEIDWSPPPDTTPDGFTFTDQTGAALSASRTSNAITVSGITAAAAVSIAGHASAEWRKNGGAWTNAAGTVVNGDVVEVRVTSAATDATGVSATLTIGGVSDTFTVTTGDSVPSAFSFTDQTGVGAGTVRTSNAITVSGTNIPSPISVSGGEYSINGGAFTSAAGTVSPGDSVVVRHTSSALGNTTVNTTLTIQGISDTFSSTTGALPATTFRTKTSNATTAAGSLPANKTVSVAKGAGAVAGWVGYAYVQDMNNAIQGTFGNVTSPGWTLLDSVGSGASGYAKGSVLRRVIAADSLNGSNVAAEPSNYVFTTDSAGDTYRLAAVIEWHEGLDTATPEQVTGDVQFNSANSNSLTAPGKTATADGPMICFWAGSDGQDPSLGSVDVTVPATMSRSEQLVFGSNYGYIVSASQNVAAGSTGDRVATLGSASRPSFGATIIAKVAAAGSIPVITSISGGAQIQPGVAAVVTGTDFGAGGGSSDYLISPTNNVADSAAVTQTVGSRTATTVNFTPVLGNIGFGKTVYSFVKNASGVANTSGFPTQFFPAAGEQYKDIVTPNATAANRITATPDIAAGDQLHVRGVGGGAAPAGLSLNDDGTFYFSAGNTPAPFEVRCWDASDQTWGAFAIQSVPDTIAPTAPGTPVITQLLSTSVTIGYTAATDNFGVTAYEAKIGAGGTYVDYGNVLAISLAGLNPSTAYTAFVRARDAAGNRSPEVSVSFTTPAQADTQAPTSNGAPVASAITATTATVTWPAFSDNVAVTEYETRLNGGSWVSRGTALSAALTGLAQLTLQTVDVRARDAAGNVSSIVTTTFTTLDGQAPTAPGTPAVSEITGTTATVTYTAATDNVAVTGYESSPNNVTWTNRGNVLTFGLTGLADGVAHTIYVRAYDAAGNKGPASQASFTTLDVTAPSGVTGVVTSLVTSSGATVNWNAATDNVGVTGYRYRLNAGASVTLSGTARQTVLSGLTPSTAYTVEISARDAAGNWGAWSLPAAFTTAAAGTGPQVPYQSNAQSAPGGVTGRAATSNRTTMTFPVTPVAADYIAFALESLSPTFQLPSLPTGGAPYVELVLVKSNGTRLPLCSLSAVADRVEFQAATADTSGRWAALLEAVQSGSITVTLGGFEARPNQSVSRAFLDGGFTLTCIVTT